MEVGQVSAKLTLDDAKFDQTVNSTKAKLEGLKGSLSGAEASSSRLAAGVGILATALGAVGLKSIKMAGDLEQTRIAFTTMLGSAQASEAFIKDLYAFAAKTPFEFEGLASASRQLLAFGFQSQQIVPMMTSIGNAISGLGGGDVEIQRVTRALGQMQAKGKVSAEEMMQLAELGIPVWQMLADSIGVSIPEAMKKAEQGGVSAATGINAILEGMNEKFPNMMEKQSESLLGIWSNFKDNISQIMTGIGEDLIENFSLKGKLKTAVDSLDRLRQLIADEGLQGALEQMSLVAKTAIAAIAGAITAALIPAFIALAKAIWAAIVPLSPFIAAGAALAAIAYLIHEAWSSNMFGIQNKVKSVTSAIQVYFSTMVAGVMTAFNKLKSVVFGLLSSILNAVSPVVGVIGNIAPAFEKSFDKAQKAIADKGGAASKEAERQADLMKKSASNLKSSAGDIKEAFSNWSTPGKGALSMSDFKQKFEHLTGSDQQQATSGADSSGIIAASKGVAKELQSAWEATAEVLKTKLSQIKASFGIVGNELEMTGTKAQQLKNDMDSLTAQIDVQKQVITATSQGYEKMKIEKGENSKEAQQLKLKLLEEQKALSDLQKELYNTTNSLKDQAKQMRDLSAEVTKVEKKYKDDLVSALQTYQEKVKETNTRMLADEANVTRQYQDQIKSRTEAISNFVGIFDAVSQKNVSGQQLLTNLRGQAEAFDSWRENISDLAARGVDEGLIEELRKMGPKAGPEIAALNTLTDDELTEYVALWHSKNQSAREEAVSQLEQQRVEMQTKLTEIRQKASEQLELYRIEWEKKNAEIRKNADEEMNKIQDKFESIAKAGTNYGVSLMQNFTSGMQSQFDVLRNTLEQAASIVDSYMPHSPAKVGPLKRLGEWGPALIDTFAEGIKASMPRLESVMNGMSSLTAGAMSPALSTVSNSTKYGDFNITVQGNTARDQAEQIMRELHKLGVRF